MAQFHNIKFLKEVEGLSQRQIATKLGISRNTVSKYLKNNTAPTTVLRKNIYGTKEYSPETKRVIPIIDQWLEEDQKNWRKQKHTAIKIFKRLQDEYDFKGSASYIRKIVAKRRQQIQEAFIPLDFQLGHQFQFDWGEADIILQGRKQRIFLFCVQLSASRIRFVRAYLHEKQEAFLDGFVHAFEFLGGVPTEGLLDNLKTAVTKILQGRDRLEQESFIGLQAHYVFKAEFCNPASGNEKGRVEGTVGYIRRNALVPLPEVQSVKELNDYLLDWCLKEAGRTHVPNKSETVLEMWEKEKEYLHPLPANRFEACKLLSCKVNKTSLITVETNRYSVPCSYVGQAVWAKIFVDRAIRDAHAFQSNEIPEVFKRFHLKMREQEGSTGDRKFIRLLLLHRDIGMDNLTKALLEAEKTQVFRYENVHEIIQRLTKQHIPISTLPTDKTPINLLDYKVNKSNIEQYGQLTGGSRK